MHEPNATSDMIYGRTPTRNQTAGLQRIPAVAESRDGKTVTHQDGVKITRVSVSALPFMRGLGGVCGGGELSQQGRV